VAEEIQLILVTHAVNYSTRFVREIEKNFRYLNDTVYDCANKK